jgi:hypothetical protein
MIEVKFMQGEGGLRHVQVRSLFQTEKSFGGNPVVKKIPTGSISVSGGLPGDMHKHVLEKIASGGQGKLK